MIPMADPGGTAGPRHLIMSQPPVLITGVAGFIGNALALRLLEAGRQVVGLDNVNAYYDVGLKEARLRRLAPFEGYSFARLDLTDGSGIDALFRRHGFRTVIHLAAQAGVRYSLTDPHAYASSNLVGFLNILEACRHGGVEHLLYASSSSVYGAVTAMPFSVHQNVDHPVSLYAATKKANELMAHSYSHLYGLPTTGLRFFTVYGPWGRPDMAMYLFTQAILAGEPIRVFNEGRMRRDFTYIDDIVEGIVALSEKPAAPNPAWSGADPDPGTSAAPYRVYNIGNNEPVELTRMIALLEDALGRKAETILLPMQPGDVPATYADIADLTRDTGFRPATPLKLGIERFVAWYRSYHGL
ncbi:UDP-glucuronate 4-epimerase [Methylobacterium pseudosasicola]|uniref:UDP-glucuronate 4-epimerase n=2 Tax=Methylobacterium pseudosasicola TaxID=582667 RepID=A0A1I4KSY0_9HYPH|nr:UDP-glucuronate 4-epimerase [Methylobacterium pseudosasicola]